MKKIIKKSNDIIHIIEDKSQEKDQTTLESYDLQQMLGMTAAELKYFFDTTNTKTELSAFLP